MNREKVTSADFRRRKEAGEKIAVATAYDATMATLLDAGGVDALMVGDSLGMVIQGKDNTLSVTLGEMVYHCRAVARAKPRAHIVCDLPFLSYQVSVERALLAAGKLLKEGGAEAVKLEGGASVAPCVRRMVEAGIPVMGHLGLTPQSLHRLGGFRVQAKTEATARLLLADAISLQDAGVYALVLEGVPSGVATRVTELLRVPTIGIGAGSGTDGQVLVSYDFLGMYGGLSPKFVRRFAELGQAVTDATSEYVSEVRNGNFPAKEHSFSMLPGEGLAQLQEKE